MCRLKEDPATSGIKCVVMTGLYTRTHYRNEAVSRFHVDDYVHKPVDFNQLRALLQTRGLVLAVNSDTLFSSKPPRAVPPRGTIRLVVSGLGGHGSRAMTGRRPVFNAARHGSGAGTQAVTETVRVTTFEPIELEAVRLTV